MFVKFVDEWGALTQLWHYCVLDEKLDQSGLTLFFSDIFYQKELALYSTGQIMPPVAIAVITFKTFPGILAGKL